MKIDQFWEFIFSEESWKVQLAWDTLADDERAVVREHLQAISGDLERIDRIELQLLVDDRLLGFLRQLIPDLFRRERAAVH